MERNLYDGRGYTQGMPTLEEVEDALTNVIDPELGLDFVESASSTGSRSRAATSMSPSR